MLFSDALELAIGLTFIFLLMSLMMTALQEMFESWRRVRGATLFRGIVELLSDPSRIGQGQNAAQELYEHPQIQGLYRGSFVDAQSKRQLPSYIPARNFALAIVDQILAGRIDPVPTVASLPPAATTAERLRFGAERIASEQLRRAIKQAVDTGGGDLDQIRQNIEDWYDSAMDRVSGWYRRRTQMFQFWVGLLASVVLNVNAFVIADALTQNAALRRAVATAVELRIREYQPAGSPGQGATPEAGSAHSLLSGATKEIQALGLPIGWGQQGSEGVRRIQGWASGGAGSCPLRFLLGWMILATGWLMTALATTLGAPFWFDLLNRLMVIRATVKPKETTPESDTAESPKRRTSGKPAAEAETGAKPAPLPSPGIEDPDPVVDSLHPRLDRPREGDEFEETPEGERR